MKMNKAIFLCIALSLVFCMPMFSQRTTKQENFSENHSPFGRKKKEKGNQHGLRLFNFSFKRAKSNGNADHFASNSAGGKHGFFTRIFKAKGENNASLRKTKPGSNQNKEQRSLFKRSHSKNKNDHERVSSMQKKERSKKRIRGNDSFRIKKRQ